MVGGGGGIMEKQKGHIIDHDDGGFFRIWA